MQVALFTATVSLVVLFLTTCLVFAMGVWYPETMTRYRQWLRISPFRAQLLSMATMCLVCWSGSVILQWLLYRQVSLGLAYWYAFVTTSIVTLFGMWWSRRV